MDTYEHQLLDYLRASTIPADYQQKILAAQHQLEAVYEAEGQRRVLKGRINRLRELYEWGHITQSDYLKDRSAIQKQLSQIQPQTTDAEALGKMALFLRDIGTAWEQASQEQRNALASCLFVAVWIKNKEVAAVTPRPEFKPFFDLRYEGVPEGVLHWRPRGDLNPRSPP